ncbi:MAG: class I SAM-dependent methyltransferase, partial [Candidatus Bathyarchaeota archaeon]
CCGVGTNPIYLAEKGFDVIGLDLSDEAVKYARNKSQKTRTTIALLVSSFLNLPFKHKTIGFVFDFGCFHHVEVENRASFIRGVNNVLKTEGMYLMVCFSYKNGPAWNHFRKDKLEELFGEYFDIKWIKHISSVEGDKVTRYFYEILMENR